MPDLQTAPDAASGDDLSALAWVHGELRRSLDAAHKALRRHVKEAEAIGGSDVDAVDPAVLRSARVQIHQGVGALELVGLPVVAQVLRASEAAVQRFINKPKLANMAAADTIERVSFAVLDYLARLLAGKTMAPLALFPQYAAAQALAGAERVHPADLWALDWQWRKLPPDRRAQPHAANDAARGEMEWLVLALMRVSDPALQRRLSDLCAGLGADAEGELATLWQLAAGFFEGQAAGLIAVDMHTKRMASRLLALLRAAVRGQPDVSDRLAQDLLFFCVRARLGGADTPRLAAVQSVWPGNDNARADYETPRLGLFDPAQLLQARKRVAAAKDSWSAVAGGELNRLAGLTESFALLADSVTRLFPGGDELARVLQAAAAQSVDGGVQPEPALAMEVATGVLYLDASLEDGELDAPVLGERIRRLAQRIGDVAGGDPADPLEHWMEELYRRISDRQTMGSVVHELRASLSEIEKQIDQYFRDPARRELLIPVPAQLSSMRGVLSVLGMDQASHAVLHMRDDVDALAQTEVDPQRAVQAGTFDRLADNLGALSFLIDMLSVQPQLAKTLFRFDPATGNLSAVMGQSERVSAFAAFESDPEPATYVPTEAKTLQLLEPTLQLTPSAATPAAVVDSGLEDDPEMREVFLEEAREVLDNAQASAARLLHMPDDLSEMTSVRRAFHTLKGSSRMVGLKSFGEAAWSCEQLYNTRLAQNARMDPALHGVTTEALAYLGDWIDAIAAGRAGGHTTVDVARAADSLRLEGGRLHIELPAAQPAAAPEPQPEVLQPEPAELPLPSLQSLVPELPSAADLDLAAIPAPAPEELSFELDLASFDATPAAPVVEMPTLDDTIVLPTLETPLAPPAAELLSDLVHDFAPDAAAEPERVELSLDELDLVFAPADAEQATAEAVAEPEPEPVAEPEPDDEPVKEVGALRIPIPLFNIFLNEADEQSRRLATELAEWAIEQDRPVSETAVALAHSLAGNSGTVGFSDLSHLARALEHALARSQEVGQPSDGEAELFTDAAEEVRRLLHQFAAGFLKEVDPALMQRLAEHELALSNPERDTTPGALDDDTSTDSDAFMPPPTPVSDIEPEAEDDIDVVDALDGDLFPIFEEEADELLPQLRGRLADWVRHPSDGGAAAACMRTLHTFKGGARLAGAMRVGEMAHRLESGIERLAANDTVNASEIEHLLGRADVMASAFERLRRRPAVAEVPLVEPLPVATPVSIEEVLEQPQAAAPEAAAPALIDWSRFAPVDDLAAAPVAAGDTPPAPSTAIVRVRATLLDRLVNQAGEVSITRARIDADMRSLDASLDDLTENLDKLRRQLRDIELQAETQISSRMEAAKAASQSFDPLEMDRFTRFQELTRMMAESVNDVATVQRSLQRTLQSSEDELAAQARLTRELQDDLLRTRMTEFDSLSDRLYRVVRLAAKETGKTVRLDIVGGSIEVDRGVLDRMVGPFEHLLRNSVAHGIESPDLRRGVGKDETGTITITVQQEGNEVAVEVRDDGTGLDLLRIRQRAIERGLIAPDAEMTDGALGELIFVPGFSTADSVSGLAGRGVGMDVVRSEVNAMGGRIDTETEAGQGTRFRMRLPLTTAVTQVVMLRFDERQIAVPSTVVEVVRLAKNDEIERAYASGEYHYGDVVMPFYWLGALLQAGGRGGAGLRTQSVVVLRSAQQRVAVHVDEVMGNQEVVVKNLGAQLARVPGLAGITLLPSGAVAMIYNPVALATVYGPEARARMQAPPQAKEPAAPVLPVSQAPLVMVVDDSLTVRRVTQRLLTREGYRVTLAKDGMEALEKLADERPVVLLSDIEMPRMDGFDLVRNVRADPRLAGLPVIMITSRFAQKHRDYAAELGVEHYLGKPYAEDELLALVARHAGADISL